MNKYVPAIVLAVFALTSVSAQAIDRLYGVVGMGFADGDLDGATANGLSYRFAIGHEYHRQWNFELGYQNIVDEEASGFGEGLAATAITLSALGKASNREGELFYRIGLANIDVTGQTLADNDGVCANGSVIGTVVDVGTFCGVDENVIGGVVGLGFDVYTGLNSMVRIEGEYLYGESEFSAGAVYIGFRYNFN
jgi:hypothetical protein